MKPVTTNNFYAYLAVLVVLLHTILEHLGFLIEILPNKSTKLVAESFNVIIVRKRLKMEPSCDFPL
jgi:hypothetical protein